MPSLIPKPAIVLEARVGMRLWPHVERGLAYKTKLIQPVYSGRIGV